MADLRTGIVLLNGANFPTWKLQVRMVLMKQGVWKIVNGTEVAPDEENIIATSKFNDRRDKALSTIVLAVETSLLYLLGDPQDPVEVWNKLCDQFQAKTWANKLSLRRKLYSLKLKENESVQDHIKAMVEIFDSLAVIGEEVEEEDRVVHILTSLPESYNMLVTAFEASSEVPKIEIVTERLLNEEKKVKEKRGTSGGLSGEALFTNNSNRPKVCFHCGESGHIKRFCPKLKKSSENEENKSPAVANFSYHRGSRQRSDSESSGECLALVSEVAEVNKKWMLDSAASRHMCKDRKMFQDLRRLRYPKSVKVGDGSVVIAKFQGTIKLQIRSVNKVMKFKMKNVLYVPELKYNLLSVSQAAESGKIVSFDKFGAEIKDTHSGETVGTATKIGELYKVNIIDAEVSTTRRPKRRNSDAEKMEKALLSVQENNFTTEIMKRLNKIEEDKLKLTTRLNNVEEDMSYKSYTVTKEDFQNQEKGMVLRKSNSFKDSDQKTVIIQEDNYEDSVETEEDTEISDREDSDEEHVEDDSEDQISGVERSSDIRFNKVFDSSEFLSEEEVIRCRELLHSLSDSSICSETESLIEVIGPSEIQESPTPTTRTEKRGKLKNRLVLLKKRLSKLFRR